MRGAMGASMGKPTVGEERHWAADIQNQLARMGELESSVAELSSSSRDAAVMLAAGKHDATGDVRMLLAGNPL
jgi:hypothetical protein